MQWLTMAGVVVRVCELSVVGLRKEGPAAGLVSAYEWIHAHSRGVRCMWYVESSLMYTDRILLCNRKKFTISQRGITVSLRAVMASSSLC